MSNAIACALLGSSGAGLLLLAVQVCLLLRHVRNAVPIAAELPGISVLKPLCGADDDLQQNLRSFALLDYPVYEVLLGVRSTTDPAYPVACEAAANYPARMHVVLQDGAPGLNPKVNQLITLAERARYDVLVVSDSNVAVGPGYLREIAGYLGNSGVGLVTHPIVGCGERTLGAAMDNAHLSASIAPAMVAAMRVASFPIVVGKSMALRRTDLSALGGFESVKDVLAEDFVLGSRVHSVLGKQVVVAHRSITAVSRTRSLSAFFGRYARWGTIQRRSIAPYTYAAVLLMHPLPLALFSALLDGSDVAYAALLLVWAGKALLEDASSRALGAAGVGPTGYCALPLKDVMLFAAWVVGCYRSEVDWRGTRLTVGAGTRLSPLQPSSWPRRGSLRRRAAQVRTPA